MNFVRLALLSSTLLLLACPSEDPEKGRDIPVAKTAVKANDIKPAAPNVVKPPVDAPGRVVSAKAASQPASQPASAPQRAKPLAPSLASCFKFPKGITILTSEEQIKKLKPDADGPEGCPKELPPSGINFAELSLVIASQTAKCSGRMTGSETGFVWTETGKCDEKSELRASVMVAKDKAKSLTIKKLEQ